VTPSRPLIMVPGRFAESTSVTRWQGVVNARGLLELIAAGGGEPLTVLPRPGHWLELLDQVDGVVLPGGSDLDPAVYGGTGHPEVYGVDSDQDAGDLSLARETLARGVPLLAVCRGFQVVNVARGGSLVSHMDSPHRHTRMRIPVGDFASPSGITAPEIEISCYHHQAIDQVGEGITPLAWTPDGVIEAAVIDAPGYAVGVQWHPEDNYATEPGQRELIATFIGQAAHTRA